MPFDTLQDLMVDQLADIYSAETQLIKALPALADRASTTELAQAFRDHLEETEGQLRRLEQIFKLLDETPGNKKCKGMAGLIEEGAEVLEENGDPAVIDAALIADAQRVEHYEISAYGSVKALAALLGHKEIVQLLDESQEEETAADKKLSLIATADVNARAAGTDPSMAAKAY